MYLVKAEFKEAFLREAIICMHLLAPIAGKTGLGIRF